MREHGQFPKDGHIYIICQIPISHKSPKKLFHTVFVIKMSHSSTKNLEI